VGFGITFIGLLTRRYIEQTSVCLYVKGEGVERMNLRKSTVQTNFFRVFCLGGEGGRHTFVFASGDFQREESVLCN
jgi:hypothetical protein